MSSFKDINCEEYSDRAIVVRGETKNYKDDLVSLGGKYNARLKGGPGWIFSKKMEVQVYNFIKNGKRLDVYPGDKDTSSTIDKKIYMLEKKIDIILAFIKELSDRDTGKNISNSYSILVDSDSEIEEEITLQPKRLLGKNKKK